jgi:hypothetical protein
MGITGTVRQAKLRPECADRYPTLPARMWTSASRLAELVAASAAAAREDQDGSHLPEADFEFQGGSHRWLGGLILRTRSGELAFAW